MLLADYDAYIKCQEQVSTTYAVSIVVSGLPWSFFITVLAVGSL